MTTTIKRGPGFARRSFMQAASLAGLGGLMPREAVAQVPLQYDGSKFQLRAPEPNAKPGGVLRLGVEIGRAHV